MADHPEITSAPVGVEVLVERWRTKKRGLSALGCAHELERALAQQPALTAPVGVDADRLGWLAGSLEETANRIARTQRMALTEWADREQTCREAATILSSLAQQPAACTRCGGEGEVASTDPYAETEPCPECKPNQQLAADGGFTAADMMDARQEGREEARQPAADRVCPNTLQACRCDKYTPCAAQQPAACAQSWHDYGKVNRAWCSRCNAVAVIGHEERPYGVLSVTDDGKYRTNPIQQPAAVDGVGLIAAERRRQIAGERFAPDADLQYTGGELARAAACYVMRVALREDEDPDANAVPALWPWARCWWKPKDRRSNLVRAGALIAAELDRMDRGAGHG